MNRIFVEKKAAHNAEARHLLHDLRESLGPARPDQRPRRPALRHRRPHRRRISRSRHPHPLRAAGGRHLRPPSRSGKTKPPLPSNTCPASSTNARIPPPSASRSSPARSAPPSPPPRSSSSAAALRRTKSTRVKAYVINAVDSHEVPVAAVGDRRRLIHARRRRRSSPASPRSTPPTIRAELGLAMSAEDVAFCQTLFPRRGEARPQHHRNPDAGHLLVRPLPPHHLSDQDRRGHLRRSRTDPVAPRLADLPAKPAPTRPRRQARSP